MLAILLGMESGGEREFWRYDRQMRFEPIGPDGQRAIRRASVVVVGCGALGSVAAGMLVRAGVGRLTVVDRDIVELHNLQRQPLFTEEDLREGRPKAVAAEAALKVANSDVAVSGVIGDFNYRSARRICEGADLIIDGTDNFETRLLINDLALEMGMAWVYGGVIGSEGVVKAVVPGRTSCLRCLLDAAPEPGESPTCETAGIIAPAPAIVASLQVALALRLLVGEEVPGDLHVIDVWKPSLRSIAVPRLEGCPACVGGERRFLAGEDAGSATAACGSDSVQVLPAGDEGGKVDLEELALRLRGLGEVVDRRFYIEFDDGSLKFSIFPDGRCIVRGTDDPARARAAVTRYLGG